MKSGKHGSADQTEAKIRQNGDAAPGGAEHGNGQKDRKGLHGEGNDAGDNQLCRHGDDRAEQCAENQGNQKLQSGLGLHGASGKTG